MLFHRLDADDGWGDLLPLPSLQYTRKLAESKEVWAAFLAGNREQCDLQFLLNSHTLNADAASALAETHEVNCERIPQAQTAKSDGGELNGEVKGMDVVGSDQAKSTKASPEMKFRSHSPHHSQSPRTSDTKSPYRSRISPTKVDRRNTAKSDIAVLSALVRRRLAIESVEDQLFHCAHGALPEDDERYEIDVGMMPGDDGGLTNFEELLQDDAVQVKKQASVYTLLGSNEEDELEVDDNLKAVTSSKERRNGTPKRPRSTLLGVVEHMEAFIRESRVLCERHCDAASEESENRKDSPKNATRKNVQTASVVEEFKDLEQKVRVGKIERMEDCISNVLAILAKQDETFSDILHKIKERADALSTEYRVKKESQNVAARVKELTTGVLGAGLEALKITSFANDGGDENDILKRATQKSPKGSSHWTCARRKVRIPFSEADLKCWPSDNTITTELHSHPRIPRVPIFSGVEKDDENNTQNGEEEGVHYLSDNIVTVLGVGNPVMRNVIGWERIYRLRAQAFSLQICLNQQSASRSSFSAQLKRGPTESAQEGLMKTPPTLSASSKTKQENTLVAASTMKPPVDPLHVTHSETPEYEIRNDPYEDYTGNSQSYQSNESRERALVKAVVALLCVHGGYTHASSLALEMVSDLLEDFIFRIGLSLASCRENVDSEPLRPVRTRPRLPTGDERFEMLRLICSSGFRGDFADLEQYVRSDIPRTEQALREAEIRLHNEISQNEMKLANKKSLQQNKNDDAASTAGEEPNENNKNRKMNEGPVGSERQIRRTDVVLNDNAFTFGHLSDRVTLDVLGRVRVPRALTNTASEEVAGLNSEVSDCAMDNGSRKR